MSSNINEVLRDIGIYEPDYFGIQAKIRKNAKKFERITEPKDYIKKKNKILVDNLKDIENEIKKIHTANKDKLSNQDLKKLIVETINYKIKTAKALADAEYPKVQDAYSILSYTKKYKEKAKKAGFL